MSANTLLHHPRATAAVDPWKAGDDRELVERARRAVARRAGCGRAEADERMRRLAGDAAGDLPEVARRVLTLDALFADLGVG